MRMITLSLICAVLLIGISAISNAYEGEWHDPDRPGGHDQHEDQDWHGDRDRHEDQDWHGSIRERIREDHRRIEQGVERGSLTRDEARRLDGELDGILDKIDRMSRDGHLDGRERDAINRDLDRLNHDITNEKREKKKGGDDNAIHFDLKL